MRPADNSVNSSGVDLGKSVALLFVSIMLVFGLWTRFSGLGGIPLALDEYYFITSVHNILDFGIPRYPDGGYYVRGILLQYLTAFSILLFGDGQFAYRFLSALFGSGTLVMAYLLGRRFLDRTWSLVLVAMLTFSSWEIEFSRFIRMYSAFQFVAVCFFWSLYRFSFDGNANTRYIPVAFAMLAIVTHELGIFMALLLFLPLIVWPKRNWVSSLWEHRFYILISLVLLCIGFLQVKISFRLIGVSDNLPDNYIYPAVGAPNWFEFGTAIFGKFGLLSISISLVTCLIVIYWFSIYKNPINIDSEEKILKGLLFIAVGFAVFYQFAMSGLLLLLIALRKPKIFFNKPYTYFMAILGCILVFWFTVLFFNQEWIETVGLGGMLRTYLRSIRLAFFSFPDLYTPVFRAWVSSAPFLGLLMALAMAWQVMSIRRLPMASIIKNPIMPILLVVVIMGFQPPLYIETRYSHFLYPLVLCVGLLSASQAVEMIERKFVKNETSSKALVISLALLLFAFSEDFNAYHLKHLQSDVVVFRTGKYEKFEKHWYPRWDFQKPAEFINARASADCRVVVSHTVNTTGAYLNPEFALYWTWDDVRFPIISRDGGTRELWSGAKLISNPEDLIGYTKDAKNVWLVVLDHELDPLRVEPENVWPERFEHIKVFTPGRDKRIEVWKIDLN